MQNYVQHFWWLCMQSLQINQIVNYLGQVNRAVKGTTKACSLLLLSVCCQILFLWTKHWLQHEWWESYDVFPISKQLLRPSYRQSTLLHIFFKSHNSPCLDSLQSETLVTKAVINALFTKNTKSDSKHLTAIVNKSLFIAFDLSADLTQIIYCPA